MKLYLALLLTFVEGCYKLGEFIPGDNDCYYKVCSYGDEPWVTAYGSVALFGQPLRCPNGLGVNRYRLPLHLLTTSFLLPCHLPLHLLTTALLLPCHLPLHLLTTSLLLPCHLLIHIRVTSNRRSHCCRI